VINQNLIKAFFIRRINRFVIECLIDNNPIQAYLPNPGRLWELLYRGSEILLLNIKHVQKYEYHAVAVKLNGYYVLLDTHYNNELTKQLIEGKKVDFLKEYNIEREEYTIGNSRFDFLLSKGEEKMVLEVKSCTLFYNNLAMFPDAVSKRAKKHIEELVRLNREGLRGAVLFVIYSPFVNYFLPEFNVDIEFAESLYKYRKDIIIKAIGISNFLDYKKSIEVRNVDIPWDKLKNRLINSGSYLLVIFLMSDKEIEVGHLGYVYFKSGYYIYVGSAMINLNQRIDRHKRKNKKLFWHIDYLLKEAQLLHALPIRSNDVLECDIAKNLKQISDKEICDFGSSDCNCKSHLFQFDSNPIYKKDFINLLLYYRMGLISNELEKKGGLNI
jgi:sugar fermentation stimulation protein A